MENLNYFAIIAFAALIHASFQLSVSVLTLLGGHALSAKHSHARLMRLTTSFISGVGVMTILLLSFISLVILDTRSQTNSHLIWSLACGILIAIGIAIWLFYYRRKEGTTLWIPRSFADFLTSRTKATHLSAEAFGLGLSSVFSELLFIIAPLFVAALALTQLAPSWQLLGILIYVIISMFSVLIVWALIGGGHSLGKIQKWREKNKYFLQFAAGAGLIILSGFVYVTEIIGKTTGAM